MLDVLNDGDWREAFGYAGEPDTCATSYQRGIDISACLGVTVSLVPFTRDDVEHIGGACAGENDGAAWIIFGRLKDGRWFFLDASCDYTGWDCQAGGSAKVGNSEAEIISLGMTKEHRERFRLPEPAGI